MSGVYAKTTLLGELSSRREVPEFVDHSGSGERLGIGLGIQLDSVGPNISGERDLTPVGRKKETDPDPAVDEIADDRTQACPLASEIPAMVGSQRARSVSPSFQ